MPGGDGTVLWSHIYSKSNIRIMYCICFYCLFGLWHITATDSTSNMRKQTSPLPKEVVPQKLSFASDVTDTQMGYTFHEPTYLGLICGPILWQDVTLQMVHSHVLTK